MGSVGTWCLLGCEGVTGGETPLLRGRRADWETDHVARSKNVWHVSAKLCVYP